MKRLIFLITPFVVFFSCKSHVQHVADAQVSYYRTTDEVQAESNDIMDIITPYKSQLNDEMETIIGELPEDLKKARPNSNMGNWFCDALHDIANLNTEKKIDFAVQNYGGLRKPFLSKGPLYKRDIFELMPFDNKLVILDLDAELIRTFLNHMTRGGGWPVSKGLSFKIVNDAASEIQIGGESLDKGRIYRVALPDYIANGGGDCFFFRQLDQEDTGLFIREAVIDFLDNQKVRGIKIEIDPTQRIKS